MKFAQKGKARKSGVRGVSVQRHCSKKTSKKEKTAENYNYFTVKETRYITLKAPHIFALIYVK